MVEIYLDQIIVPRQNFAIELLALFVGQHDEVALNQEVFQATFVFFLKNIAWTFQYLIEVEADGKKGSCTFAAPGFCGDKAPKCGGDVEISVITAGCDKASEKGAAPAVISELKLPASPKAATITVSRDGKKVGELKSAPQYKEVRPNGPDCDPVCKLGDDKLTVR